MTASQVDVLIIGAGPVGLFLANECARRGIAYRVVKDDSTQSQHSKALAIYPRTLEVFDMAGVAEPFMQAANRVTGVSISLPGRDPSRTKFEPKDTPYPFIAMVPQDVTEKLLLEEFRAKGGDVEYETAFVSLTQTDSGVTSTITHAGKQSTVEAKYVVGCDGAHSAVRQTLGLPFEGGEYSETYLLADVMANDVLTQTEMHLCPGQTGPCALFPMGNRRWRIVATAETVEGDAPSLDVVNAVLAKRGPQGFRAESPVWTSYFTIHHRCVSQMSSGRVFVCGDAAHIHSPYGGQGMNTGLQDAWNLAWKLDVTLRGFATDALLASYSGERHPIVLGVIATTDRLTKAMTMHNPLAVDVRNAILPILTHIPMFQRAFTERMSGLGNAYEGSPIVAGGGKRYLDDSLRGGKGVGRRFILVVPRDDAATTSEANNLASQFPEVLEVRLDGAGDVRLVRPDGYLAYEGPSRPNSLTHVEEVLRRQVRTTSSVSS